MSATSESMNADATLSNGYGRCRPGAGRSAERGVRERRGNWTPFNTVSMVLGFVFFWPVGLVLLFWILSGRNVRSLPGAIREQYQLLTGRESEGFARGGRTGNRAFDEFQRTQYDRIREIKDEIVARGKRFQDFRADAQRRRDDEEFERFMATAPVHAEGGADARGAAGARGGAS